MKETTLTCPFTGIAFTALKDTDGNLYFKHPITGETLKMNFNNSIKKYNLPKEYLKPIKTVTLLKAAEMRGVSRQRASAIATSNTIKPIIVNGQTVFLEADVIEYSESRKVGAPKRKQA